jgi:hypothetical protein
MQARRRYLSAQLSTSAAVVSHVQVNPADG